MRNGWRKVVAGMGFVLLGTVTLAASPGASPKASGPPVRMTVEITWRLPQVSPASGSADAAIDLDLELSEGQVIEALAWPPGSRGGPEPIAKGWRLGEEASGRVRARIEAPLGASFLFRGCGQLIRIPILTVLDGPQRTGSPVPLEIGVERLPWDALEVDLAEGDGTTEPGGTVPVAVGFNILTPEPMDVALRCSAELRPIRGGEPLWRREEHEVVSTNVLAPVSKTWDVPAPRSEGTYVLEVRSSWEPVAELESTRLGRWLRRRRNPLGGGTTSTRRVSLVVLEARPPEGGGGTDREVETIDLSRLRGPRPSASGRTPVLPAGGSAWAVPEAALIEATRRDRLRGWINRAGSESASLPPADAVGLAWSALGLKVPHPGRPHRLSVSVAGGPPSALGVALVDSPVPGGRPRVLLDACASGPPGAAGTFSWVVWPDAAEPVLVLVNRDPAAPVQLGTVTLTELADLPASPAVVEPGSDPRGLGLYLSGPNPLDRFGGEAVPADALAAARHLARYLAYCGASTVVLPEGLDDRGRRRTLDGQAGEDAIGPDRLDLLLRVLERQKCSAWLELAFEGALPGLPAPDSAEALARGLVRVDRRGLADGPAYHPLHPEVREALRRRVAGAAGLRKAREGLAGLLIRLGPGPTLLGGPDTGLDDATFSRFVRETFGPEMTREVPGLAPSDPNRFAARSQFLAGPGRMPWLNWRSKAIAALYSDLSEAARGAGPGIVLAVATPGLVDGAAGHEARRVDLSGLPPGQAWRAIGLDLGTWPSGPDAPVVLRGATLSGDELAHDLATSPELDAQVASRPGRGLLVGVEEDLARNDPSPRAGPARASPAGPRPGGGGGLRLSALPAGAAASDELMGHALAALDARWVFLAAAAVSGREERVRRFARVFRGLPGPTAANPAPEHQAFGVVARTFRSGGYSYLSLANDTPYPLRLETVLSSSGNATVDDLGRGLRLAPEAVAGGSRLVLDLLPFGVGAIRVGSPQLLVGPMKPYPSEAVVAEMQARYEDLSGQLSRLSRSPAEVGLGPANPGFEPPSTPLVQLTGTRRPAAPGGWQLAGGMANALEVDPSRPHSGRGSLRLTASTVPAAAVSERFAAKGQSALTVQAWFRADAPDTRVRVWIDGEAGGQPYLRWSELTVQSDWAAQAVRASEVPAGGLDSVRLRFEMLTTGSLWVDDVGVSGEALTEAGRLNARRVLIAALHAYREKRYADFARLAGSHWTRALGPPAERTAADHAEMIRTGKASALPSNRLLR